MTVLSCANFVKLHVAVLVTFGQELCQDTSILTTAFPKNLVPVLNLAEKYQTNQINRKNTYPYSERNRLVWHNNDLSLFVKPPLTHPQTAKTNAPSLHQTGAYLTWANRICVFTCPERHRNIHWSSLNEIRSVSAKDLVWVMDNLRPVPTEGRYG